MTERNGQPTHRRSSFEANVKGLDTELVPPFEFPFQILDAQDLSHVIE